MAERGYFDRNPNEKITLASIKRRVEKWPLGITVLDEEEWEVVLKKILPRVGATVLIKDLPKRIEDVLRIRRGKGGVTTELQFTYISGAFGYAHGTREATIKRYSK